METAGTTPEWLVWLFGAIGALVAGFVAKKGWSAGDPAKAPPPENTQSVVGALVDGRSVMSLAGSIEAFSMTIQTAHKESEKTAEARMAILLEMARAVKSLSEGVSEWNKYHQREEEDRERRERERIEREAEQHRRDNEQLRRDLDEAKRKVAEGRG